MISSRLTSKAQTTIPQAVRTALKVHAGDRLAYQIEGDRVVITKAARSDAAEDPFASFTEWDSDADRKAYGDL